MTTTEIELALCARVLGVDEGETPDVLVRAARLQSWALPALLLSMFEKEGHALGVGSSGELRRMKARRSRYAELLTEIEARTAVRVLKGPSISRHYPAGLLRPVGDLDLVVAEEAELWEVVRTAVDRYPHAAVHVSLLGHPRRHVFAEVVWPGEDPMLDREQAVEVCTAAFPGAQGPVRIRAELPEDELVTDLLAIAEERFQRPFGAKDVIDVAVLARIPLPDVDVVTVAEQWRLAPELLELFELTAKRAFLGGFGSLVDSLRAASEREQARRLAWTASTVGAEADRLTVALASGKPVGGLLLRDVRRDDLCEAEVHPFDGGALLVTPVGDYLLVDSAEVTQEQYDKGLTALALLDGAGR